MRIPFGAVRTVTRCTATTGASQEPPTGGTTRASTNGSGRIVVSGALDLDKITTSYAERQNLSIRTLMRPFTRLTNAF